MFANLSGQGYTLNYKDPSTFSVTCGSVNPAQWEVKNDSCLLYTPVFYPDTTIPGDSITVDFVIRINQSGNLDPVDNAYIHKKVNSGSWEQKDKFDGNTVSCVFTYSGSMNIARRDNFQFRIALQNNSKNNFWQIKDGDIQINNVRYSSTMPVEFLGISAIQQDKEVLVSWSTASELNNNFFTVERSEDGVNFESIGFRNGAGNSNSLVNYYFTDVEPLSGLAFYRIRQTDYDGNSDVSSIAAIDFNSTPAQLTLFPNPVKQGASIGMVMTASNAGAVAKVFSYEGKLVIEKPAIEMQSLIIDGSFSKGLYTLMIVDNGVVQSGNFIVE